METRLFNIFKTANVIFYRVLKVTSKWKTLKQSFYFLRAIEFWPTCHIQIDITLAIFKKKVAKLHFLESPQKSLITHQHSYEQRHPLRNNSP